LNLRKFRKHFVATVLVVLCPVSLATSAASQDISANRQREERSVTPLPQLCAACVRSNLDYLAGPSLHGRGSGTEDEHQAARFIAHKLKQYGLAPAAEDGRYIQTATVRSRKVTTAPAVSSKVGDAPWTTSHTWNVLAKIEGTDEKEEIILLSAHLDHLGVKNGKTYPGADDDASGTVAVMELARALAKEPRPRRTIVFALWGSEEKGLVGVRYFLKHPTFNLQNVVANVEFEMIGRPDPKLRRDQLWLTGWERTDLGPELAAHGARLVVDPRPDQNFFARSDNYALAKDGIVAQTISSFGLHKDYHQPTDTLARIDWQHLDRAIASMVGPVTWLANSDFTPKWKGGQKP
jgi:hypothetical protein